MASSGLPLIASKLQGIVEGIENGKTGYLIEPGDHKALADKIEQLVDNPQQQKDMSIAARKWILNNFSREKQIESLVSTIYNLYSRIL
jgi:glycosyltransferase involved in cell wall biosynthesis